MLSDSNVKCSETRKNKKKERKEKENWKNKKEREGKNTKRKKKKIDIYSVQISTFKDEKRRRK